MATGRGKVLIVATLCMGAALGCGARTDTLFDDGAGGYADVGNDSAGGASAGSYGAGGYTAGSFGTGGGYVGGYNAGGSGAGFHAGGSIGTAGTSFGGFGAVGGFFGTGGVATGGSGAVAGFGAVGGIVGIAGTSFGGFGAVGGSGVAGSGGSGGSGGIVDLCVGVAQTSCNKCLCTSCGSQLNGCFGDLGCVLVLACVQETNCQALGCYQASTCRGVIDQFGGLTGSAIEEVFSLASCTATTRSTCGCN